MIKSFNRLFSLDRVLNTPGFGVNHISTLLFPLQFQASPTLWAEPLKKKKKIDPMIIKMREERKRKRIRKEIRKLEKLDRQLKPVVECEIPICLNKEPEKRKRNIVVPDAIAEERILLLKEWSRFKFKEHFNDQETISKLIRAQQEALDELRLESEDLYKAAVKIDTQVIPFKYTGPAETPPKEDYQIPDGNYIDVSKKWGLKVD